MGAWGVQTFENDDAGDWVWSLEEESDLTLVRETLSRVADAPADEYLEAPECSEALAAAEVAAAVRGRPSSSLPAEITAWIASARPPLDPGVIDLAIRAVDAVAGRSHQSELQELWDESDDAAAWQAAVADLRSRLI